MGVTENRIVGQGEGMGTTIEVEASKKNPGEEQEQQTVKQKGKFKRTKSVFGLGNGYIELKDWAIVSGSIILYS